QMPPWPTSKYHLMPSSCANSRVSLPRPADAMSLAGWKWSWVMAMRSRSQTSWAPICSRMILPAGGIVRSWPIAKSTLASTRSPGRTDSRPEARARIFSDIVMPIAESISLQPSNHRVTGFGRRKRSAQVSRAVTRAHRRRGRVLDPLRRLGETEVLDHHSPAENGPQRVDHALAGEVGRAAVDGLVEAEAGLGVDVGAGRDAHAADQHRGEVGQDVAEQVAGDDDLELARVAD